METRPHLPPDHVVPLAAQQMSKQEHDIQARLKLTESMASDMQKE